jgi:CRISPR system Cascade subunit CasC
LKNITEKSQKRRIQMSNKNFVNFHIITSHSASNLNRDDMGLQKTALFGGKKRTRISSQCEKRAMNTSNYYKNQIAVRSIRSRHAINEIIEELKANYSKEQHELLIKYGLVVAGLLEGTKSPLSKKLKDDKIETQVIAFSNKELEKLKNLIAYSIDNAVDFGTSKKSPLLDYLRNELKEVDKRIRENLELDIAYSGRMATCKEYERIDAALAVAQVITTHTTQSEIDWFTAVDDLSKDGGSAHIDSQEFGAGVFYKYASLNIGLLQKNLGNCSREKALVIATHTLHMLATVTPTGKQNSYAAFNPADFAMVTLGDQPISLANAFETPVQANPKGGFLVPSIKAFSEYKTKLFDGYSLDDKCAYFSLVDGFDAEAEKTKSLKELKEWLQKDGI